MSNQYYKTTKGYNAEVIVANKTEYSVSADYKAFVASAVEGEIGVFNSATKALISGLGPVAAGTLVFIAQKRDGSVHKTTPFKVESGIGTYTNYTAPVKEKWTIDSSGVPLVVGEVFEFAITELTRNSPKYQVWNFDTQVKAGDTIATVINRLVAQVNAVGGVNYAFGQIAVASNVTNDIVLEAAEFGRFFKVSLRQALIAATVAKTTAVNLGAGTAAGIAEMEAEGAIFDGVTTNFPGDGMANPEDFGAPTRFAAAGSFYDQAIFRIWADEASPTPINRHHHKKYIFLALPNAGVTPTAELKLIFGF